MPELREGEVTEDFVKKPAMDHNQYLAIGRFIEYLVYSIGPS